MKNVNIFQGGLPLWLRAALCPTFKKQPFFVLLLAICLPFLAKASPDFSIFYDGNSIQLSDQMGGNDVITVTEVAGEIHFDVPGRTYAINGGAILNFPVSIPLAGANIVVVYGGDGNDVINIGAFITAFPNLIVGGGEGNDVINFNGDITFLQNKSMDVNLQDDAPVIGTDRINVAAGANLRLSGLGDAVLKASLNITINGSVETVDGNILVEANMQPIPSAGNFKGVEVNGGLIDVSGDGYITVKGRGGNDAAGFQQGVSVINNGAVNGGDIHLTYVEGWGGNSSGIRNYGVGVENNAAIKTNGGPVTVIGTANGNGASANGHGVLVNNAALIAAGGNDVYVDGTGCMLCNGTNNNGVAVSTATALILSVGGDVTVKGLAGGSGASGSNMGVNLFSGGFIESTGNGNITVEGTGGRGSQGNLRGVNVQTGGGIQALGTGDVTVKGTATKSTGNFNIGVAVFAGIESNGGDVTVTGFGAGEGASASNYGVFVNNNPGAPAFISADLNGNVKVTGKGAYDANGAGNIGVAVAGSIASIDADNGNVEINGTGGGAGASSTNAGVVVASQGVVFAGGSGTVSIQGLGGKGTGNNNLGVSVETGGLVNTAGGDVSVIGQGTGAGSSLNNHGVQVLGSALPNASIQAGINGKVSVRGTAGNTVSGSDNYGVLVSAFGQIASSDGNIEVIGQGGGQGPSSNGYGVTTRLTGRITATGDGVLNLKGTGGGGVGASNIGVLLAGTSVVSSANGNLTITGVEGTSSQSNGIRLNDNALIDSDADITLIANSMLIGATASITNNTTNSVSLRQLTNNVAINLGANTDPVGGSLNLTDLELDRITTGELIIGNTVSGSITVSTAITRSAQTDISLITSGAINLDVSSVNTAGGLLTLQAAQGVNPKASGVDVQVGTVAFAPGTALNIQINGTMPDAAGYTQFNVEGIVNLTGSKLTLTGTFNTPQCNQVVIVKNDGNDAVIGTFNGMPEGYVFVNYLGSGKNVSISYVGGDGNDVVLIERVIPLIACPGNITSINAPGECGKTIPVIGSPNVVENCQFSLSNNALGFYPIGVTEVIWVVTDVNGNSASCVQTITIKDAEHPAFDCPDNILVLNQEDVDCGAIVHFAITATDNCPGVQVDQNYTSGDVFGMGITYVEATATDASGNITTCAFKITVDPRPEICNGIDDDCDGYTDELQSWDIQNKVNAADAAGANQYGQSVDMKGEWAVVGSNQKNGSNEQKGTAYLLHRDPATGNWAQVAQFFPDNSSAGDVLFGSKVAMGNGFCAVSAPLDDENLADAGAIYIYKYDGPNPGDWSFYQKVLGTSVGEQQGSSLDYFNELLVAGAILNSDVTPEAGAAYLYTQTPAGTGNWGLVKKITAPDSNLGDHFGFDVAVSGDRVLVTAKDDDETGVDAGAAYIFGKDQGGANNWGLIKKITASDADDDDNFGVSADLDGGWAVVGANKDDDKGPESGSAYVFHHNQGGAGNWGQYSKITDYNGKKGEHFGYAVSIQGEHIAIGARWKRVFQSRAGAVFVYHKEVNGWAEFSMLTDPDNLFNDQLGSSVALDNFSIIAGIPGDDLPQKVNCGSVLTFVGICGDQRPSRLREETAALEVKQLAVQCYPVPFDQTLTIQVETPVAELVQVRVFDFMGREIALLSNEIVEGSRNMEWNAAGLPAGSYFVRVSTESETITRSVIHTR